MSESVISNATGIGAQSATATTRPRKSPPPKFPNRLTVCMADDQIANLQEVKKSFRATESFIIRMAFDTFCRTNGFANGGTNGR